MYAAVRVFKVTPRAGPTQQHTPRPYLGIGHYAWWLAVAWLSVSCIRRAAALTGITSQLERGIDGSPLRLSGRAPAYGPHHGRGGGGGEAWKRV